MEIKRVKLTDLKFANYNPKSRTAKESLKLKKLVASMQRVGLLYPILVSDKKDVIDGHRRICAARQLGWEDIPAIVANGDSEIEDLYGQVNANSLQLSARERLAVWLKNPNAVTEQVREKYEVIEANYGRQLMVRASEFGASASLFNTCEDICDYVGHANEEVFRTKVANWLIRHRNPRMARYYMNLGQPPKKLYHAIMEGRPLAKQVRVNQ